MRFLFQRDRCLFCLVALGLLSMLPRAARAEEWLIHGSRSMGMGGAGVASTRGAGAVYWNPAALARSGYPSGKSRGPREPSPIPNADVDADVDADEDADKNGVDEKQFFDIAFGFNLGVGAPNNSLKDIASLIDNVENLDFDELENKLNSGTPLTDEELQALLQIAGTDLVALSEEGKGVLLNHVMGPQMRFGRFGFGLIGSGHGAAFPTIDLDNLAFGFNGFDDVLGSGQDRSSQISSSGQSLADDLASSSSLTTNQAEELVYQAETGGVNLGDPSVRTIITSIVEQTDDNLGGSLQDSITNNETGANFGGILIQELSLAYGQPIGDWLALGVALKGMHAYTSSSALNALSQFSDFEDVLNDFWENKESSFNVGVDAGVLVTPTDWLALGVTGRNLNSPSFKRRIGNDFVLDPNARAGVAFFPNSWLMLAADMDLFRNQSDFLPGYRSQQIGGGAQVDLKYVALRFGLSKNIADSEEDILLHAGLAVRIWRFHIEFAGKTTPSFEDTGFSDIGELPQRAGLSLTMGLDVQF